MRAMVLPRFGGPELFEDRDVERPEPGPGEVLVRVVVAGTNPVDAKLRADGSFARLEPPVVLGSDVSGVVEEVGAGVSDLTPGDEVYYTPELFGPGSNGGYAEYHLAEAGIVAKKPPSIPHEEAAAVPLAGGTAYEVLIRRLAVRVGETVLIHGGAGGVGTAGIQVARGLGARTIAVVSSDEKEQVARDAGADEVVRSDGPWKDQAKELSDGGVDVVLDPVGGDRFTDSLRSLAEGGRAVVVGFTAGSIPEVKVNRLLLKNTEVVGAGWGAYVLGKPDVNREIGAAVNRMVDDGVVRPVVGASFPLERASEALELIDGRGATGKVVLGVR